MKKKNRRTFLKLIVLGIISFIGIAWNKLTKTYIQQKGEKVSVFPLNKNQTVSFFGEYIVIHKNNKSHVLSSKCSHLGCTINKTENDKLLCPCHGSEYDLDGKVLKGPAYKNLETISAEIIDEGKKIEIRG